MRRYSSLPDSAYLRNWRVYHSFFFFPIPIPIVSWASSADHYSLWRGCFLSSCSVSIYERPGLRHRKAWWETGARGLKQSCFITYSESFQKVIGFLRRSLFGSVCIFFLYVTWALPSHKPYVEYAAGRSPQESPSTSWCVSPLLAPPEHIVSGVWIVVMDPFHTTPKRRR